MAILFSLVILNCFSGDLDVANRDCSFFNLVVWNVQAVDISRTEYELSDMDILYADGITSSDGLASTEFTFPQIALGGQGADEPDPQDTLLRSVPSL
jgi:hypothetical protein